MKIRKMLVGLAVVALSFGLFTSQAAAETTTSTINVYAGLSSVLEMSCTNLNFGVWRVPSGERTGGANTIGLTKGSVYTVYGDGSIAKTDVSGKYSPPATGACTVTGSEAATGDYGTASIASTPATDKMTSTATLANPFASGLDGTAYPVTGMGYVVSVSTATPAFDANGATSFEILGTLTIPNSLSPSNYGSYVSTATHTVTLSDNVQ